MALKDLRKLPLNEISRTVKAVNRLADEPIPHGSKKLANSDYTYRIRVGDYRVVYDVIHLSQEIHVARVGHRKDIYRS